MMRTISGITLAYALAACVTASAKNPKPYKIKYPDFDGPAVTRDQVEKRLVERGDSMLFYQGEPFTGILYDTISNTGWPMIAWYRDGHANGPYLGFYDQQRTIIRFVAYQRNDKREGDYYHWFQDGTLSFHCFLYRDKITGRRECYHRDGTLWHTHRNYKADKENGVLTTWYGPCQREERCPYRDGKRHGYYRGWYRSGQLKMEGRYIDDLRQGEWTQYNEDGTVKVSSIYKDGAAVARGGKHPDVVAARKKPRTPKERP